MGDVMQDPRDDALAEHQHHHHEAGQLGGGDCERPKESFIAVARSATLLDGVSHHRQHHQRQHHGDVFDDQPADGDAAALGLDQPALLQRPQQHDGGSNRQSEAEHNASAGRPAKQIGQQQTKEGGDADLGHGAGNGDGPHFQQIIEREMQPDAEHQQDHADFGQLVGNILVRDEARCERAHQDAGDQITDEGRNLQSLGNDTKAEGQNKADYDRGNKRSVMMHAVF